ncbi:MAG: KEOPS complex subunit Pcc1 [Promethearchaeota archaeon]
MKLENRLTISLSCEEEASLYYRSIHPDVVSSMKKGRARTNLKVQSKELVFEVSAADATAMRAALNSILQVVKVVEDSLSLTS